MKSEMNFILETHDHTVILHTFSLKICYHSPLFSKFTFKIKGVDKLKLNILDEQNTNNRIVCLHDMCNFTEVNYCKR